jgi:integrase
MPSLQQFADWLEVVKQYNKTTTRGYVKVVSRAMRELPTFDYANLLTYLKELRRTVSPGYYSVHLGALKHYTKFIGKPELLAEFSHPPKQFVPKTFWKREQIAAFYNALSSLKMKALFLMGATTGLRKGEILSLRIDDIDHSTRMIMPKVHSGRTKHSWVSFYNAECEAVLREYMDSLSPVFRARGKLFPLRVLDFKVEWRAAKERSGVPLKFKDLRDFFAESMINLGVQTIYIDAFAGRAPGSVLAKHYVDLSPQKLKQVYEQAGLSAFVPMFARTATAACPS